MRDALLLEILFAIIFCRLLFRFLLEAIFKVVLVAKEKIDVSRFGTFNRACIGCEKVRREKVVVVGETNVVARRCSNACVGVGRDAFVLFKRDNF